MQKKSLPFPTRGDLPDPGIEPISLEYPALAGGFLTTALPGKPVCVCVCVCVCMSSYTRMCITESLCRVPKTTQHCEPALLQLNK